MSIFRYGNLESLRQYCLESVDPNETKFEKLARALIEIREARGETGSLNRCFPSAWALIESYSEPMSSKWPDFSSPWAKFSRDLEDIARVLLLDQYYSVRRYAIRTCASIDPDGRLLKWHITEKDREKLLRLLQAAGKVARPLRNSLVEAWNTAPFRQESTPAGHPISSGQIELRMKLVEIWKYIWGDVCSNLSGEAARRCKKKMGERARRLIEKERLQATPISGREGYYLVNKESLERIKRFEGGNS